MFLLHFAKKYRAVLLISIILFILPFFWLAPGEMDLGGDDTRLFFYDPITYVKNTNLYDIRIEGKGTVLPRYSDIPYIGIIALLKFFFSYPTLVISFINSLKLAGAFIAIYLITYEFLKEAYSGMSKKSIYTVSILAGIFYIISLGSHRLVFSWETALISHNEVFLSPLIFYLTFKFFLTYRYSYLWAAILISFIFAPNFGFAAAPSFFAFYPLAFLFLIMYIKFFLKKSIPWKGIYIGIVLFLGIHAFHLFGQFVSLFDSGNYIHARVFNKSEAEKEGLSYFLAVRDHGMAVLNLLLPSEKHILRWASFIAPATIIIGFLLNGVRKKMFLLVSIFFLITLFLVTANITSVGFEFYKSLFYIPAFSMFRVFFVKWMIIFLFFYSLLFGFAAYNIVSNLKPFYAKLFSCLVFIVLIITGIPLFTGLPVKESIVRGSNNVKTSFVMDPLYEQTLQFIRKLPDDGKILVLPLTDFYLQVVYGKDGGAYAGPSTLRHLTTKYSFAGDQDFGFQPNDPAAYLEVMKKYGQDKNYDRLLRIFTTLNIRYIFHNADPKIYEESFSRFEGPYAYIKAALPNTQQGYIDFIRHFPARPIYANGQYTIYEIDKSAYNPTIFIPDGYYQSDKLSFDGDKVHSVFINNSTCNKEELKMLCRDEYKSSPANINFRMINPTLYEVTVRQNESAGTMLLVMQHTFHKGWKLIIDGKYTSDNKHISVNGYANAWFLSGKELPEKEKYTLFIQLDPQKYFWYGLSITSVSLITVIGLFIHSLIYRRNRHS